jgi:hypothetical protein
LHRALRLRYACACIPGEHGTSPHNDIRHLPAINVLGDALHTAVAGRRQKDGARRPLRAASASIRADFIR